MTTRVSNPVCSLHFQSVSVKVYNKKVSKAAIANWWSHQSRSMYTALLTVTAFAYNPLSYLRNFSQIFVLILRLTKEPPTLPLQPS